MYNSQIIFFLFVIHSHSLILRAHRRERLSGRRGEGGRRKRLARPATPSGPLSPPFSLPCQKEQVMCPALRRLLDVLLASSARKKITRNSPRLRVPTCPRAGPPHVSANPSQPGAGARVPRPRSPPAAAAAIAPNGSRAGEALLRATEGRQPPAARPRRRATGKGHLRELVDSVGSSQKF